MLPGEDETTDDDAPEDGPAVAAPWLVPVVGWLPLGRCGKSCCCSPLSGEPRTTRRGAAGRPTGLAVLSVETSAEASGASAAEGPADASSAWAVSITLVADVTWPVSLTRLVGVTCRETSALAVSVTFVVDGAMSIDIRRVPIAAPIDVICSVWVGVSFDVTCGEMSA